jgi:hypothetical protein
MGNAGNHIKTDSNQPIRPHEIIHPYPGLANPLPMTKPAPATGRRATWRQALQTPHNPASCRSSHACPVPCPCYAPTKTAEPRPPSGHLPGCPHQPTIRTLLPPPPFSSRTRSRSSHTHMAQRRWGTQQPLTITLDPMEAFQPSIGAPLQKLGGGFRSRIGLVGHQRFFALSPTTPNPCICRHSVWGWPVEEVERRPGVSLGRPPPKHPGRNRCREPRREIFTPHFRAVVANEASGHFCRSVA